MIPLVLLLSVPVFAQFDDLIEGEYSSPRLNDVRARAMGRTEIINATGSNAIFYNPANIGMVQNKTLQAGGRVYMGTMNDEEYWDFWPDEDWEGKYELHPKITHISFAMPYQPPNSELKFAFGIGYNTYFDFGTKASQEYTDRSGTETLTATADFKVSGGLNTISPAAALNIDDKYFVGLAFHKSVLGKIKMEADVDIDPEPAYIYLVNDVEEGKISATFVSLGATGKFMAESQLTVGVMYRSGFELKFEDLEWSQEYSDGTRDSDQYDPDNYDFKLPAIMGLGVSYQISPEVLIAGEYQTRPFSDIEDEDGDELDWIDNGSCYRLGMEYQAGSVPLRLGYFSDAILEVDYDDMGQSEDKPKSLSGFTGGIGIVSGNITLDFFGEYAFWGREDYGGPDNAKYEYKETLFAFGVTFTADIQ
jgi:long-subunit fatty acid transport protein